MLVELDEFRADVINEIAARLESQGGFPETVFTEYGSEALQSAGVIDSFQLCNFSDVAGKLRLDGYSFDDADDSVMVCVSKFSGGADHETLLQADARSIFGHLIAFLRAIANGKYVDFMDVGDAAYDFAITFRERMPEITKIRAFLLTDSLLSSRVKDWPEGTVCDIPTEFHIWDIARFLKAFESQSGLDEVDISFAHLPGGGLACLRASLEAASYEGFLAVLPAAELALIYETYGSRLLEGNVRSFLSTKGKINQGIRKTLLSNYPMFFAYNNGISCVATHAEVTNVGGSVFLTSIKNLQIVNGGQTTASILNAQREDHAKNLDQTFVPMKLSIVQGDEFSALMKDISLYANSQNKVTDADLASNDPYQIRFEEMSRRIQAPAVKGAQFSTRWYYERARGQYANEFYKLTARQRDAHRLINPKHQLVTKLDLARLVLVAHEMPYVVAQGAQRMIMEFSKLIRQGWDRNRQQYGDQYFRDRIADLIIYRQFEARVVKEDWYVVGYKAIIVAYAMSWLWRRLAADGRTPELSGVWRSQEAPAELIETMLIVAQAVFAEMNTARDGKTQNTTQLAKRQTCWEDVKSLQIEMPGTATFTISLLEHGEKAKESRQLRAVDDGIEAQRSVVERGRRFWIEVLTWFETRGVISATDRAALIAASSEFKPPSERQALRVMALQMLAEKQGFMGASVS